MEDNQEFQAISVNEVPSIDVNQIDSLQLKDGTLLVVQDEVDQVVAEGEQFYEEVQDQVCEECAASLEDYADDQSNQLRARPMMGVAPRPLIAPRPMLVVPMGPIGHKPMVVPRGPIMGNVMPMGRPIFRARPGQGMQQGGFGTGGYGKQQGGFGPQQGGFGPQQGGFGKQQGGFGPQQGAGKQQGGVAPQQGGQPATKPQIPSSEGNKKEQAKPVVAGNTQPSANQPSRPVQPPSGQHQTINNMIQYGGGFRARPKAEAEEEDYQEENLQQEEDAQYECNYCDEEYQGEEQNLRARPMVTVGRPMVPVNRVGFPHPKPVMPLVPQRRGPAHHVPMVGYNTYQPRVFRARRGHMGPTAMYSPLNPTFQPKPFGAYGMGVRGVRPTSYHHGRKAFMAPMGPVFRNRPRSNSCDKEENVNEEQNECQLNTEGAECNKTCVCSKCGKEF